MTKEQELLRLLYECQEQMGKLLDKGVKDPHYIMMQELIKRLEMYLQDKQDLI